MKIVKIKALYMTGLLLMLAVATASCSSDSFKVDGDFTNLDGLSLRVMYEGDSCIVDENIDVDKKGHFSYEGQSSQPTVLTVMGRRNEVMATVVVVNGDHLKIKGDAGKAFSAKVKGNKLNEAWQLFRDEHADFYADANPGRRNASIEKYVRENPKDMLSTVLLMVDYSNYADREKVAKMLNSIDREMRPMSLTAAFFDSAKNHKNKSVPRIMTMSLRKHNGDFEELKLTDRVTLLNMWAQPQNDRAKVRTAITSLVDGTDNKVQVLDVLIESDTLKWQRTIVDDPSSWMHYWAPGGPLETGLQLLGINVAPWYAVVDSTGMVAYSGADLDGAIRVAREKTQSTEKGGDPSSK